MLTGRYRQPSTAAAESSVPLSSKEIVYDQVYRDHFEPRGSSASAAEQTAWSVPVPSVTQTALDSHVVSSFGIGSSALGMRGRARAATRDATIEQKHHQSNPAFDPPAGTGADRVAADIDACHVQQGALTRHSADSVQSGITTDPSQKPY